MSTWSWSARKPNKNNLQIALCNKSSNNNDDNNNSNNTHSGWNCSSCNSQNQSSRNDSACSNCGIIDSDRNRIKANAFYQFGIISSPSIYLLPPDIPFFINPLSAPKISFFMKTNDNGITIRFIVNLTDSQQTAKYNVSKIRFAINSTSNGYHKGYAQIIDQPTKPATFDSFLSAPYHGKYKMDIWALISYKIGDKYYKKTSPKTTLTINLKRTSFYHETHLKDYIISQSKFDKLNKQKKYDEIHEKYYEPQLIELISDSDDYQMVYFQFIESAKMKQEEIESIFIYKISNKHRNESYKNKRKEILKLLNNDKSKLNELPLYHGTDILTIIKILHQGFLRQFATRTVYGKGTYFARDASYSCSKSYAKTDDDGFQHLLLCNVICGEWCVGHNQYKLPPSKPNNKYLPFETTVNNVATPSVFVTYQDDQAKPTYLISFKSK